MPFWAASVDRLGAGRPGHHGDEHVGVLGRQRGHRVGDRGRLRLDRLRDVLDVVLVRRLGQVGLEACVVELPKSLLMTSAATLILPSRELAHVLLDERAPQHRLGAVGELQARWSTDGSPGHPTPGGRSGRTAAGRSAG